jgi:outer membrane lipoprotein-sorting protein
MNITRKLATTVFLLTLLAPFPFLAAAKRPPVKEVLREIDRLYRGSTSRGEMEMTVVTPDWKRTLRLKIWTEGMEKTFVVILSPKKDAGVATLRVGKDMWNFFPRINKTLKVPPSMMMGSWMGSDFTNDDLVKESTFIDDYNARYAGETGPEGTWTLELTPKAETASVWGKILLTFKREGLIPLQETYFDEHGEKVRVLRFSEVKTVGKRKLPLVMELESLKKSGHRTLIRYVKIAFDEPLPASVFTLQNLRQAR